MLADCIRGPDDWTWKNLYDAAEKQVRLHTKTREWTLGGFVGGGNYAAQLYRQTQSNPDKFQRDDCRRVLDLLTTVPASHDSEGGSGQDFGLLENSSRSSVKGSRDGMGWVIKHSAREGPTSAFEIYATGHEPLSAALSEPEAAAAQDHLERSRPWVVSLPGPNPRSEKSESEREAIEIKLSDEPGLPLSELRVPRPRTRTSLAPDRSSNSVWLYGLERRKRLARLSDFGCGQTVDTGKTAAGPARSRSTEESTPMGNHGASGGGTPP